MNNNSVINTPYDDAFKSIIKKCPSMTLPLINEMFYQRDLIDEEYTGKERVQLLDKELPSLTSNNLEMDIRVIVYGKEERIFHLECQSTSDGTMVLRMIRYDTEAALAEADSSYVRDHIHIKLDDSGVFFLRSTKSTPDMMTVDIVAPQGQSISYQIPTIKMQDYSLDVIMEKRLFIMLPFLFFNYESKLKRASIDHRLFDEIDGLYGQILSNLRFLADAGNITAYEASTLFDALGIVLSALGETNKAEKEVERIMGGRELVFSADSVYNDGKVNGETKLARLISFLLQNNKLDEIQKATTDQESREELYREYSIV